MYKGNREEEFDWFVIMRGSFDFVLRLTGDQHLLIDCERFYGGYFSYISDAAVVTPPPNRKINSNLFQHPLLASRQRPNLC